MNITNSPDITLLQVQAIFDLSAAVPVLRFVNQSVGAHLGNVTYAFRVTSPSGQPVHAGNLTTPDASGAWTTWDMPEPLPPFGAGIEWSGNPYQVSLQIKDSTSKVTLVPVASIMVGTPRGNEKAGGNYGLGVVDVAVDCQTKEALIRDRTPYVYGGITGKILSSSSLTVLQPPLDSTGIPPAPSVFSGFSQVVFPLTVSGEGFKAVLQSVVDYDLTDFTSSPTIAISSTVRVKYIRTQPFDVNCNYDLCPVLHEYAKMLEQNQHYCEPKTEKKIARISNLITEAILVKMQPMCGVSLGKLIDQIKLEGGWNCDCNCVAPIGLNGNDISAGALNIQFSLDGDMSAAAAVTGSNILLTLKDYRYVIQTGPSLDNRAFSVTPTQAGRVKTFTLNVDLNDLAEDLLDRIGDTPGLMEAFNALVKNQFNFTVDGKCIINTDPSCNYSITIDDIPGDPPLSAMLKSITIGEVSYPINISFNDHAGLVQIQNALNQLGKGTFSVAAVSNPGTSTLSITSTANPNSITSVIVYGVSVAEDRPMAINKFGCAGAAVFTPSQIVQAIINYLCKINTLQVKLGYDFTFAGLNPDGTLKNIYFKSTDSLKQLIDVLNSNWSVAISTWGGKSQTLSCDALKAVLANTTKQIKTTDTLFATRDGDCGQWTQSDLLKSVISMVNNTNDAQILADWCKAINRCNQTSLCNPVTSMDVAMRQVNYKDFLIVGGNIVFVGNYTGVNLPVAETITLVQQDQAGNLGTVATATMPINTSVLTGAIAGLPSLATGFQWIITAISNTNSPVLLGIDILNNGSGSYRMAYRRVGSGTAFTYSTYPKQDAQFTRLLFSAPSNNYEASVIAVCGVNNESIPFSNQNAACPAMQSFNVVRSGSDFLISYSGASTIGSRNLVINYPNGGVYDQIITGAAYGTITVPIPVGVFGEYRFKIRSVCDAAASWYGPFTNPLSLTLAETDLVAPIGLQYSLVTQTTARATAIPPTPAPAAISITLIVTLASGGTPQEYTQGPNVLVWDLSGLAPGTEYNGRVRYNYPGGATSAVFDGGNFTTLAGEGIAIVLSGWTSSTVNSGNVDSFTLQQTQNIPSAGEASYNVDFSTAPQYKNFIIREPATSPIKTGYQNGLNNESIPDFTFAPSVVKGPYRYYFTNAPKSFESTEPVRMRS